MHVHGQQQMQLQLEMQMQMQNTGVLRVAQGQDGASGAAGAGGVMSASQQAAQRTAKLADGAHQFEAMMLQEMLKPLKFGESPDSGGGDDDSSGGANGTLQSYGTEVLAKAISLQGGFGIAKQIIRQVAAQDAAHPHGTSSPGIVSKVQGKE
jgi:flagellar protein FlgJ